MPIIMVAELESRAWLMRDSLWFISSRDLIGVKFNGHCRLPPHTPLRSLVPSLDSTIGSNFMESSDILCWYLEITGPCYLISAP